MSAEITSGRTAEHRGCPTTRVSMRGAPLAHERPLRRSTSFTALIAVFAIFLGTAHAHHGVAQYDMQAVRTLEGTVEKWDWQSPHTWLTLTVAAADGSQERWEIEGAPPGWMARQGWTPQSLERGQAVTITFHPSKREPRSGILMEVARRGGEVLKVNRPASLGGP